MKFIIYFFFLIFVNKLDNGVQMCIDGLSCSLKTSEMDMAWASVDKCLQDGCK
uniref:Uncharacterized protein n=1 Tax=Octopus bimaculoides TaxID=37653 RepID=A0A0L8HGF4_OCTBM